MAISFDFTKTAATFDLLIDVVALDDNGAAVGHRRFAVGPRSMAVQAGDLTGLYQGRVVTAATVRNDVGLEPFPRLVVPDFSFAVAREDRHPSAADELLTFLHSYAGPDYELNVLAYLSVGGAVAADEPIFRGYLESDGVRIQGDRIEIRATGLLGKYDKETPPETLSERFADVMPAGVQVPERYGNDPLPILYGDWTERSSWYQLRGPVVRTPGGSDDILVQLSAPNDHGIGALNGPGRWLDATGETLAVASVAEQSLTFGRFELEDTATLPAEEDTRGAPQSAQGNLDVGGNLIESPAGIIFDLLTQYAGLEIARLDVDSFDELAAQQGYRFRNLIDETADVFDLVAEVCRDAGLMLTERGGLLRLEANLVFAWLGTVAPTIRLTPADVGRGQRITLRPDKWDYTRVRLKYAYNPATGKFRRSVAKGNRRGKTLTIESRWIWRDMDARDVVGTTYETICRNTARLLSAEAPLRLDVEAGALLRWNGDGLTDADFVVIRSDRDFQGAATALTGIGAGPTWYYGGWTLGTDPDFDAASDTERLRDGYWAADGEDEIWTYTYWKEDN
jgi:hypothetical protein